jgi:hypothetical protein
VKSRAAVQVADRRYEVDEFPVPPIGPTEGLLRIEACGICGTDIEQYDGLLAIHSRNSGSTTLRKTQLVCAALRLALGYVDGREQVLGTVISRGV